MRDNKTKTIQFKDSRLPGTAHRHRTFSDPHNFASGMSPAAGVSVPLLGDSKGTPPPASVPGAVFNVATSIVGAGIMSIPAIMKVLGVVPAFAMILVVAVLAELSVDFLMRFTHSGETTTYAGVMREAFGSGGALAAQVCVIITNVGGLILYLIIIGNVTKLFPFFLISFLLNS